MSTFHFKNDAGTPVFVREWLPAKSPRAAILIAHGAAEHSARYDRVANVFTAAGYAVYAEDHRGHGQTVATLEKAGNAGPDGFNGMIRDLAQLAVLVSRKYVATPLYLLGHSMGAALSQRLIQLHGDLFAGVILSGSPGMRPNLEQVRDVTAQMAQGDQAEQISELFKNMFASFNEGLGEIKNGFEWLSRDEAEVQKYIDDPWCGFPFTNRLVAEMQMCGWEAAQSDNINRIPKSLPIYLYAGTHDRVGGNGEYINKLAEAYRAAGIRDVEVKLYAEGRHEMLNETNREEVHVDLLSWLKAHV